MTDKKAVNLIALIEQRHKEISEMNDSTVFRIYELNILIKYIIDTLRGWQEFSDLTEEETL